MVKKRGKLKRVSSKINVKKVTTPKASVEKPMVDLQPMEEALHQLEILGEEKKIEEKVEDIGEKEEAIEKTQDAIVEEEKKIEKETEQVEKLEKEIKKEVTTKPLTKITIKDLNKGIIGAFIGVVAHFAFIQGKEIANNVSITRATVLIIFSYLLIVILMYETGYREIKERQFLSLFPTRATAIFLVSIIVMVIIFFLFDQINLSDLSGLYKQIGVTSVLASLGAGTADLIGRG